MNTKALFKIKDIYKSAQKRNKEFNLDLRYVENLLNQKYCAYSKEPFNGDMSFERIDNDKGYVKGNVIVVRQNINNLRSDHDLNSLEYIINTRHIHYGHNVKQTKNTLDGLITKYQIESEKPNKTKAERIRCNDIGKSIRTIKCNIKTLEFDCEDTKVSNKNYELYKHVYLFLHKYNASKFTKFKLYLGLPIESTFKEVIKEVYVRLRCCI